jgi:hypothetical protein
VEEQRRTPDRDLARRLAPSGAGEGGKEKDADINGHGAADRDIDIAKNADISGHGAADRDIDIAKNADISGHGVVLGDINIDKDADRHRQGQSLTSFINNFGVRNSAE